LGFERQAIIVTINPTTAPTIASQGIAFQITMWTIARNTPITTNIPAKIAITVADIPKNRIMNISCLFLPDTIFDSFHWVWVIILLFFR
jgi:hypothetical protein